MITRSPAPVLALPGLGLCNVSKWVLEGLSEAPAAELAAYEPVRARRLASLSDS